MHSAELSERVLGWRARIADLRGRGVYAGYSNDNRCIFIHIPKTAGSSVGRALQPWCIRPRKSQWRRLLSHLPVPEAAEKAVLRQHDTAAWVRLKWPPTPATWK